MSSISALNKTLNEEKMRFHDELNPSIWEGNKLKDKVAMKLMEIASNFVAYLDTEGFVVEDIIITGSMANYNYTEQSDIDLHIICDYSKLPTNCPILSQEYFQAKKKIYNDKHNIKIYGYDVELYVEDSTAPSLAGGKYSLLQRKWLRFPQKIDFEVEDVVGTEELQDLITQIENVCMTDGNIQEANELLNQIYDMRKSGLAKGGEFAFENLLFKALRNRGYLDKLRSYIANAEDLSLSLNESPNFKMVKSRGGYEKGPLPTIKDFTDYSRPWEINLYWTDKAKSLNIVKKHIYDILHNYIGYSEEITQKAMEEADIHKIELPEEHKKFFSKLPNDWEVIIKSDIDEVLEESVEKLTSNENVIYINSTSQAAQFIKSQKKDFRGLAIDDKSGYYFSPYDETTKYNHFSVILAAYKDGLLGNMIDVPEFSNDFGGNYKKNQYVNDSLSELLDNSYPFIVAFDDIQEEADEDGYTLYYDYGDFRVYDRFEAFKYLPLYKALGDSKAYDMNNNPLNEVKELNESANDLEIKDEDGSLTLLQNGYIKAECSYTNYGDRIIIDWIESFDEGQGYATKLLEYIKNKYPNVKVISGEFVSSRIANVMKKLFGEPIRGEMPRAKDYDEYLDDESKSSDMEFRLNESYLIEGISDLAKQFPRIPEEKLRKFIALDPTYKGGEQAGKYGSWIIRLFYNNIKNADRMADYKAFYEKNNGINPKTGEEIQKPELLPQTPYEDAEKIPPLLKQYEVLKKEIGKPIDSFKSIQDLYTAIQQHTQKGVPQDKEALERYNVFKAAEEKGLKEIYDDNEWIIGIPTTFESSKPFGQYTNWCTTSSGGTYYDRYLNQYGGEYYILLNKEDGALYQFHFESNQFMDERDYGIDMDAFTQAYGNIAKFLYEYKSKNGGSQADVFNKLKEKFVELLKNPEQLQKEVFYENYTKDIVVNGDTITGKFEIDSLSEYVYEKNSHYNLQLDTVCELLTRFYEHYDFSDYDLDSYSYQASDWNNIAKKYGIEKYNWDKICNIYQGNERPEEDDETVNTDIESLIQNDFCDDNGLLAFCNTCTEYGTENDCYKDIMSDLQDNLPISVNWVEENDKGYQTEFSITKDVLWKLYYVMNKKSDDIPDFDAKIDNNTQQKEMSEKWYKTWSEADDDYGYEMEAFDDWLYCWRVATGKCRVYDFSDGAFVVEEPRYGWSGFDDKYFEEGCESAAKRIAEIIHGEDKKVANESFSNAGEQPKNLNESWSDVDDFLDIQEETRPYDVLMMYKFGENNIWYPLIKPTEYKQALNEFMKYGEIVRYPEDKIYNWLKIIFKNTCLIDSITQLAGHTEWFPYDEVKDAYEEAEDLPETWNDFSSFLEEQGFYDWCKLPDGSDAWSDYGLKPLYNILNEYNDSMNAGQVLVLINRCLDVYHQRGDLASAFIDGGSASLTKISNESKLIKGKQLNESIMFNDEVYDDFQEEYRKLTVWVNPSIDWIRNKLNESGGFRFLHSIDKNKLYVFTVESGFMHQQVFDMLDFDWSKDGRNVVGVFNPDNSISIWEALADDGEASSSLKLAEKLDGDLFKQIYPNGYELTICY